SRGPALGMPARNPSSYQIKGAAPSFLIEFIQHLLYFLIRLLHCLLDGNLAFECTVDAVVEFADPFAPYRIYIQRSSEFEAVEESLFIGWRSAQELLGIRHGFLDRHRLAK